MKRASAFTMVEILIVVVLLGVLAAIVIPALAKSTTGAREATLETDLKLLRRFVEIYTGQHLEVPPGYPNGNTAVAPTEQAFIDQATLSSKADGTTAARGTPGFNRGPYLSWIPTNRFNGHNTIQIVPDGGDLPANADDSHGWVYKPSTREIRPDNAGTDLTGRPYYDY
jgi:prepilin-type N-terminal cleavage/methylation domain-containing protein